MAAHGRCGRGAWRLCRFGVLAMLLFAAVLSPFAVPADAAAGAPAGVDRIWGADRYETSVAVAARFVAEAAGRVDVAVVVPGVGWHDAVIAAGLAGSLNAPVLLSPPAGLSDAALDMLGGAGVSRIVVVDGAGSLSASALDALEQRFSEVEPMSRMEPAALSAKAARRAGVAGDLRGLGPTAILASADVFVDSMVAGPVAWRGRHPVLLTSRDGLSSDVKAAFAELGVAHVIVMGGTSAVSQDVVGELIAAQISVTRVGGATRFDTARALAGFVEGAYGSESNEGCFDASAAGIATARSPFDALSAAPLLGRRCSPLLLSEVSQADPLTVAWVRARVAALTVFGGTSALSGAVVGVLGSEAPVYEAAAAGAEHTCAVAVGGSIVCWGDDSGGRLDAPAGVFTAVAAGGGHSCALGDGGRAVCWGDDSSGQLDAPDDAFTAIAVGGVVQPGARDDGFSCALRAFDAAVICWGADSFGQVSDVPQGRFRAISAGWGHACAIRTNGTLACWGFDRSGQVSRAPPGTFTAVAAGAWHTCALRASGGAAVCWGRSGSGATSAPTDSYTAIAAGADVTCALRRADRGVTCWGFDGLGQISDVPDGALRSVAMSAWHACAVRDGGEVACWGDDSREQSTVPLVSQTVREPSG